MSIKSIDNQSVVEQVYQQMVEQIESGKWKPGEKIPSENKLAKMFGVSRISVRSSIQKLNAVGAIETRHGQGSYVATHESIVSSVIPKMNLSEKEFKDMLEFRETIEFKCIDLAIKRADEKDLKRIEDALQKMIDNKHDYKKYSEADYQFHLAVAKASKNEFLYKVMENTKAFYYYLEDLNKVGTIEESLKGHIKQFNFIKNKDIDGILEHLKESFEESLKHYKSKYQSE